MKHDVRRIVLVNIGDWEAQWSIHAHCLAPDCWHSKQLDRDWLIGQYGEDFPVSQLRKRLRCTKCGGGDVTVIHAWNVYYKPPKESVGDPCQQAAGGRDGEDQGEVG